MLVQLPVQLGPRQCFQLKSALFCSSLDTCTFGFGWFSRALSCPGHQPLFNFSRVTSCSEVLRLGVGAKSSVFRICQPWRRFPYRSCLPIVEAPKWMSLPPNLHVAMQLLNIVIKLGYLYIKKDFYCGYRWIIYLLLRVNSTGNSLGLSWSPNGIHLINVQNTRSELPGTGKQVTDSSWTDARKYFHKIWPSHCKEGNISLCSNSFRQKGLTCAWGTNEESPLKTIKTITANYTSLHNKRKSVTELLNLHAVFTTCFASQGCGLRKDTRSPKVPNLEKVTWPSKAKVSLLWHLDACRAQRDQPCIFSLAKYQLIIYLLICSKQDHYDIFLLLFQHPL